jgi:hypothetical protein
VTDVELEVDLDGARRNLRPKLIMNAPLYAPLFFPIGEDMYVDN